MRSGQFRSLARRPPRNPARKVQLKDEHTPTEVAPTEDEARLRIRWRDGHVSEFEPRYLRLRCPCAGCVEEMTGRPILNPETVPEDVYPLSLRYVGRYALQFDWSDGHRTGIYPFDQLRRMCPCDACAVFRAGVSRG